MTSRATRVMSTRVTVLAMAVACTRPTTSLLYWGRARRRAPGSNRRLALRQVLVNAKGSNAAIADFLLRNPVRATAWGIEELAPHTGISTATLSRFARTLGFGGYAAMRGAIADALQTALQPVFHPVEKLKDALGRSARAAPRSNPVIAESGHNHVRQAEKLTEAIAAYLHNNLPPGAAIRKRRPPGLRRRA